MATKTTGAEWKHYYEDPLAWPEEWFHEDIEISIDGLYDDDVDLSAVPDDAVIVVMGGVIYKGNRNDESISLESHFKKWRKAQAKVLLVVEVHKDKESDLKSAIAKAGGKIVR